MTSGKCFGITVGLFPILNIYATGFIPGISIGQLIMLPFCTLAFLKKKGKIYFSSFIFYAIFITIVCWYKPWVTISESLYELIAFVLFFFFLNGSIKGADFRYVKKTILWLGMFSCAFFYVQYVLMHLGIRISGIIPGLPMSNGGDSTVFAASHLTRTRLSAIFQEPAHFAEFMAICLAIILFADIKGKKKTLYVLAISGSMILCQSAGGYSLLLSAIIVWLLYNVRHQKGIVKIAVILAIAVLAPFLLYMFSGDEMVMRVMGRYQSLSFTPEASEYGYSSYTRLFRGYIPIMEGSPIDILFGKGIGTLLSYVHTQHTEFLRYTDYDPNWINSFQFIILYTGIIGGFLFFKQLFAFNKKCNMTGRTLVIIYILALLSSGLLLSASSLVFLYLIFYERKNNALCLKSQL